MFNLKIALKGAAAGFVISFIAGIIGRVDFLIILLRAFLSAVFSGALFGGLGVLYNLFLGGGGGGSDIDLSPSVAKTSPSGSVVDITLADEELPDSDTAPDFTIAPNVRLFDTPSAVSTAVSDDSELAEPSAVSSPASPLPEKNVRPTEQSAVPPAAREFEGAASKTEVFEPIALGGKAPAVSSVSQMSGSSAVSESPAEVEAVAEADDVIDASESLETASEPIAHEGEGGTLIDNLPDMEGFSDDRGYVEEDNDDAFGAVSPFGGLSSASAEESPVDISDAKNIAEAIRTALKKES